MAIVATASGKIEGLEHPDHLEFRGIPYAAPPVGDLRLRPPRRAGSWGGTRDATAFGSIAPQMISPIEQFQGLDISQANEDCLYLNVWTPGLDAERPVMVWIHGGAFIGGAGSSPWYSGAPFATAGTVCVSINYRLGALGFLHLDDVDDDFEGSGNLGILDQIAALEWVRDNIGAFGGDPNNVTVFGESAGAMSVGTLLALPAANGLFHNAILQSGACAAVHTRDQAARIARDTLETLGVDAHGLRDLPWDAFIAAQSQVLIKHWGKDFDLPYQPVVDGSTIPQNPIEAIAAGASEGIRVLAGSTADEMKLFALIDQVYKTLDEPGLIERATKAFGDPDKAQAAITGYRTRLTDATPGGIWSAMQTDRIFRIPVTRLLEARGDSSESYMYLFDYSSPVAGGSLGACHALELPFVFGALDQPGVDGFTGPVDDGMRDLGRMMNEAWRSFSQNGVPSAQGTPEWPRYRSSDRNVMVFGRNIHVESDPFGTERELWTGVR